MRVTGPAQGCGGVLTNDSGTIRPVDIDGDGQYEHDQDCLWRITVPPHQVVQLTGVGAFDVERSPTCTEYDYLQVRLGAGVTGYRYDWVHVPLGAGTSGC